MDIVVRPKQLTSAFAWVVTVLTVIHILGKSWSLVIGQDIIGFSLVNISGERNIPAFYSSVALLFCSLLLALIAVATKFNGRPYRGWAGLTVIFLYLAIDEAATIHERLSVLRTVLQASGPLYFAWVIPYGIALLFIGLAYLKFIWTLPPHTRRLFIIAGSIYVTGALGFEMLGGWYSEIHDQPDVVYAVLTTIEEVLEMYGIVVLIYALSSYIDTNLNGLRVHISSARDFSNGTMSSCDTQQLTPSTALQQTRPNEVNVP